MVEAIIDARGNNEAVEIPLKRGEIRIVTDKHVIKEGVQRIRYCDHCISSVEAARIAAKRLGIKPKDAEQMMTGTYCQYHSELARRRFNESHK